ncbi:MAG: NHLP bacteriocin system secretion protein [Planctomycetota bacterium]
MEDEVPAEQSSLFRKKALDHISTPEQLDTMLQVLPRRNWIPLLVVGLGFLGFGAWCIFGQIPVHVSSKGIMVHPGRNVPLQSHSQGQIVHLNFNVGDQVQKGAVLAEIYQPILTEQAAVEQQLLIELRTRIATVEPLRKFTLASEKQFIEAKRLWYQQRIEDNSALATAQQTESQRYLEKQSNQILEHKSDLETLGRFLAKKLTDFEALTQQKIFAEHDQELTDTRQQLLGNKISLSEVNLKQQEIEFQRLKFLTEHQVRLEAIAELQRNLEELDVQIARLDQAELTEATKTQLEIAEAEGRLQRVQQELEHQSKIASPHSGKLLELTVSTGQMLMAGQQIGLIETNSSPDGLIAIAYFPVKDGKKIKSGMKTRVTPTTIKRERFGSIIGEITSVSSIPRSTDSIAAIVGNRELAQSFGTGGSMIEVRSKLEPNQQNSSGYNWSSGHGPDIKVTSGMTLNLDATIEYRKPITFLLPFLRGLGG